MPARKTKSNTIQRDRLYELFARNLKCLRQQAGLKMYAAADALGVAKSTWSQWESGKRFPNGEMLAAIASSLKIEPHLLLKTKLIFRAKPKHSQDVNCRGLHSHESKT